MIKLTAMLGICLLASNSLAQWTNVGPGGQSLSSISFANANRGFASGSAGTLYRTIDGGTTWTLIPNFTTPGLLNRIRSVGMSDPNTLVLIWETPNQTQPTASYLSSNSGGNFTAQDYGSFNSVMFRVPNIGLQVGGAGTLRYSLNGGNLWVPVVSGTQFNLRDCDCATPVDCFVAGDNGTVRKNVSGNLQTWRAVNSTTSAQLNGIFFDSPLRGYIVGNNGTALRTLDGGATWIPMNLGTTVNLNDVRFLDSDIGFIAGDFGTVYATSDGGVTWRLEPTNTFENLNCIASVGNQFTANVTWIAGEAGTVLKRSQATITGTRTTLLARWDAYPNPFASALTIALPPINARYMTVEIVDGLGRTVFTQDLSAQVGSRETELSIPAALSTGVYGVRLRIDHQVTVMRRLVRIP